MSDWCSEPWKERREAEDAARRGYMNYEQRERHREGRYAGFGSCDREFYDAYERERGRIDDERRAEEDQERRSREALEYQRQMDAAYEREMYECQYEQQPPEEQPPEEQPRLDAGSGGKK